MNMQNDINIMYGGFVVSKNVTNGMPIKYTYREKSAIEKLNGWTIYSSDDDDTYIGNSENFVILGAESIMRIAPVLLEIFNAPYGTDLCWLYEGDVHVGFYDLRGDREITISEILAEG